MFLKHNLQMLFSNLIFLLQNCSGGAKGGGGGARGRGGGNFALQMYFYYTNRGAYI